MTLHCEHVLDTRPGAWHTLAGRYPCRLCKELCTVNNKSNRLQEDIWLGHQLQGVYNGL